jgi:uncharacterized protein YcbK (DUF882 family)
MQTCGCAQCRAETPTRYAQGEAALRFRFAAIGRRGFLAGAATLLAVPLAAAPRESFRPQLVRIALVHRGAGERVDGVLWAHGRYLHDTVNQVYRIMRDQRENRQTFIDTTLFDLLARIHMRVRKPLILTSGYRTQRTNEALRARDPEGVARYSLHIQGRAADFSVDGMSAAQLGQIARGLGAGGVGVYSAGFVHVDTGRARSWTSAPIAPAN